MTPQIIHGDCLAVLRELPACSVDAIVTDPPYGLAFMGKRWDYDVPSVEVWAECLRVLKPGGHLLAFAGTRTQHRMAVRIEDAGFEIRDMIAWVYGSGFPKSLDVSKAIDKQRTEDVEPVRVVCRAIRAASATAARWQGWGTALKPAMEPITVARKPLVGTVAENVLAHGTGALNIDGCRVGDEKLPATMAGQAKIGTFERSVMVTPERTGRWPANLIHDGSDEVTELFPAKAGAAAPVRGTEASPASRGAVTGTRSRVAGAFHRDSGSAARFFYCAKASRRDRNEGCEAFEKATPGQMTGGRAEGSAGLNSPRAGAGRKSGGRNTHPTVKPTDLMRYLCRLVTPPGGVVLDPFAGSGSTGKAAVLEGFRFIGIEREADYVTIARARIEAAAQPQQMPLGVA